MKLEPKCWECNDTGSMSKRREGHLDCAYCTAALERVALETWCRQNIPKGASQSAAAWLIFQYAQERAQHGNP